MSIKGRKIPSVFIGLVLYALDKITVLCAPDGLSMSPNPFYIMAKLGLYILRGPLGSVDRDVPIDFDDIGSACYDWLKIRIHLPKPHN